jgi:hypothetical protein
MIALVKPAQGPVVTSGFSISFGPDATRTDIPSVAKAHLTQLRLDIINALPAYKDNMSRYHLQDLADRIRQALDPK